MKKQVLKYSVLAWLCLTVILNGCKKEEEKKDDTTPVVDTTPAAVFLKVGNQHKYDIKTLDPTDTTYTKYVTYDSAMVWKVESLTDGVFKVKNTILLPGVPPDSLYLKKDKDGIWEKDSVKGTTFHLVVKSIPAVNDSSMSYENNGGKIDTTFRKVIATGQSVTTEAGNFSCVKIKEWIGKANKNLEYNFTYIDLGVGLIKVEGYSYGTILSTEYKLRKKNY